MAKYSTFKYGSTTKYGSGVAFPSTTPTGEVTWIMQVDWTGTGWTGYNEAVNLTSADVSRGRKYYLSPGGESFEQIQVGRCTCEMINRDDRYDPYNDSSPIYDYLSPGKMAYLSVKDNASGVIYPYFAGFVTDIQPSTQSDKVTIIIEDGFSWLNDTEYIPDAANKTTATAAMKSILDKTQYPYGHEINFVYDDQPIFFDPEKGTCKNLLQEIATGQLGTVFCNRSGKMVYYPYDYGEGSPGWTEYELYEGEILKEIRFPQPWESVRDNATLVANRRGKEPYSVIWSSAGVSAVADGATLVLSASFSQSCDIAVPIAGEDYRAWTASNGTGSELASYITATLSDITPTTCNINLKNNYTDPLYIKNLRLIGKKVVSAPDNATDQDGDTARRKFKLDNKWMQDRATAAELVTELVEFLVEPQKNPIIRIEQRPTYQFAYDLFDTIYLEVESKNVYDTFWVGGIEHRWQSDTGQSVVTTLYLQKIFEYGGGVDTESFDPGGDGIPDLPGSEPSPEYTGFDCCDYNEPLDMLPSCTDDDAPANGPYKVENAFDMVSSGFFINHFMPFSGTIRRASAANPTYLELKGEFSYITSSGKTVAISNDWYQVVAVDANNDIVSVGQYVAQIGNKFSSYNTRYFVFQPSTPADIVGFRLVISQIGGTNSTICQGTMYTGDTYNPHWRESSGPEHGIVEGGTPSFGTLSYSQTTGAGSLTMTTGEDEVDLTEAQVKIKLPFQFPYYGSAVRFSSAITDISNYIGVPNPLRLGFVDEGWGEYMDWDGETFTTWTPTWKTGVSNPDYLGKMVDKIGILYQVSFNLGASVSYGAVEVKIPSGTYLLKIREIMAYNICG